MPRARAAVHGRTSDVTRRGRDAPQRADPGGGAAWSPWRFWDGRRDSLWAQALGPFEAAAEMGSTRVEVVRRVATAPELAPLYARVFGAVYSLDDVERFPERAGPFGSPDERAAWQRMAARDRRAVDAAFANVGKAIAAYERMLLPGPSRFDRYVAGLRGASPVDTNATLTDEEVRGLRLFVDAGRTLCLRCHNGPLLTNQSFHQVGTATGTGGLPDFGRFLGIQAVLVDPFNCRREFSDANPRQCSELRFLDKTHVAGEVGKFKTPTLRGLPRTGPYMHDGRFATLEEVIEHYRHPPASKASPEITPLELDDEEGRALVAFLAALDGGVATAEPWLRAPPRVARPNRP